MKTRLYSFCLCLFYLSLCTVCAARQTDNKSLPAGLVARWLGDGDATDLLGQSNGSVNGYVMYAPALGGKGFAFNGEFGGVNVPDTDNLRLGGSLTLCAWVKIDSAGPGQDHQIIMRGDNRPMLDPFYLVVQADNSGAVRVKFHIENVPNPPASGVVELYAPVTVGHFLHLAASLDVQTHIMRIYVDGKVAAETKTTITPLRDLDPGSNPGLGIGNTQDIGAFNQPFDGVIQDVQIYDRALSAEEIASLSQARAEHLAAGPAGRNEAAPEKPNLYRYWPRFPRPKKVLTAQMPASPEEQTVLQTLSGLVARAALQGHSDQMIWMDSDHPAYVKWRQQMLQQTQATQEGPFTAWDLVKRFHQAGIVKGYILYRYDAGGRTIYQVGPYDASLNVATSLCAPLNAIAVSEKLEATARALGLKRLLDVRNLTAEECFARYRDPLNRHVLALQDPKVPVARDEMVALQAFTLAEAGLLYERALAWLEPDSPILGWGLGDERDITLPSTRFAAFQTDTNWCMNLPLLSTEQVGETLPASQVQKAAGHSLWDMMWEDNVHYATFLMSDGDNVQWFMGDFLHSKEQSWWNSPAHGQIPMGWTCCYDDLAQLCPYALEELFQTAKPNDDFLLFGGGYYYPDFFGSQRPGDTDVLAQHAARAADYMQLGHLNLLMLNLQNWNTQQAIDAYGTYAAKMPGLQGIFTINYAPYTEGNGKIRWIADGKGGEVPVISARFSIWNHARDWGQGDPAKVATYLNDALHFGAPTSGDHFSAVIVHCWSWFKAPENGQPVGEVDQSSGGMPGTGRGMVAAKWCADLLQPYVRVVTPSDLALLMRLRIHPQPTLQTGLDELTKHWQTLKQASTASQTMAADLILAQADTALKQATQALSQQNYSVCFEQGKLAATLLKTASSLLKT